MSKVRPGNQVKMFLNPPGAAHKAKTVIRSFYTLFRRAYGATQTFKKQDEIRQRNGKYPERELAKVPGIEPRKRYSEKTRITYVTFESDYDKKYFNNVPASRFAEALRAEGIPVSGTSRRYSNGCHKGKDVGRTH